LSRRYANDDRAGERARAALVGLSKRAAGVDIPPGVSDRRASNL